MYVLHRTAREVVRELVESPPRPGVHQSIGVTRLNSRDFEVLNQGAMSYRTKNSPRNSVTLVFYHGGVTGAPSRKNRILNCSAL